MSSIHVQFNHGLKHSISYATNTKLNLYKMLKTVKHLYITRRIEMYHYEHLCNCINVSLQELDEIIRNTQHLIDKNVAEMIG